MNCELILKKNLTKDILELDRNMSSLFETVFKKKDEMEGNNKENFKFLVNDISRIEIDLIQKLKNVPCIEKTQKKIKKMKAEISKYDKAILKTEIGLIRIYGAVTNSMSIAQEKLCELKKSQQQQQNTKNEILEMSKNLTKNYAISAPPFWKPDDYVKPFPTGVQFVRGCLKHSIPLKDTSKKRNVRNSTINMLNSIRNIQQHDKTLLALNNQQKQTLFTQQGNQNVQNINPKHINRVYQVSTNQKQYTMQQQNSYRNLLQRSLTSQNYPSQIPNRINKVGFQHDQSRFPNEGFVGTKRFITKPGQSDIHQTNISKKAQNTSGASMKPQRLPSYSSYLQKVEDGTTFKKAKRLRIGKNMRILPWSSFIDPYYKGYETSTSDDSDELNSEEEKEISSKYYTRKAGPSVELPVERTDSPETSRYMNYL